MNEEKRKEREKSFIEKAKIVHNGRYNYKDVHFINNYTKVSVICPIHGSFSILPKNHLKGQGCPLCGKEKAKLCHKGNYERFNAKLNEKFGNKFSTPNIDQEYENQQSIITLVCNRCGKIYRLKPNYILSDKFNGCVDCAYKYSYKELEKCNNTGNKITPFEGLKDSRFDKIVLNCKEHGEYEIRVRTILEGKGECIKCNGHKKLLSDEDFKRKLYNTFGDTITPISEYKGTMTNMTFRCDKGHIFKRTPNISFFGCLHLACPICSKESLAKERLKTTEQFKLDVIKVYGKDKYDLTNTVYEKSNKPVTVKCNDCGRYFTIEANSFLRGHGCPYHNCNSSNKEKEIKEVIEELGFKCETNCREILPSGKEIDIYIPYKKIAIEFDGLYWHNELNKDKKYHLNKTVECEQLGIRLIHIFEDEWIFKKEILVSMFKNFLGITEHKIYARICDIRKVEVKEATIFLNENHLQGTCSSTIKYGLYYQDELISIMTFGKCRHFIGNSSHEYELLRFCNKRDYCIVGAASKLFKHFVRTHNPQSVVSYADRRWSQGNLYDNLGFELYNKSKPNYYYVIGMERKNRFNFRKSVLKKKYNCDENMSEHQFCLFNKWYRIYDCGCLCYEWNNKEKRRIAK